MPITISHSSPKAIPVIYLLKFHQQTEICPPLAVVGDVLTKLDDAEVHKKAVSIFWKSYSSTSDVGQDLKQDNFLRDNYEWFILTKQTERMKIQNARLEGFVGADESWRKVMNDQQKYWERSKSGDNEYILKRESYRVMLDAAAAADVAERAIQSGY